MKQYKQTTSISLRPDLRERMRAFDVNWSAVAAEAFEELLDRLEGGDHEPTAAEAIARMERAVTQLKNLWGLQT